MNFFDCHVSYGIDAANPPLRPAEDLKSLQAAMLRADVERAVVYRSEQLAASPKLGNELLAQDLQSCTNLFGLWAITPEDTDEMPSPAQTHKAMKENKIVGFRLCPEPLRYVPRAFVLRGWLELALRHRIPLFVNTEHGFSLPSLADLMQAYPKLTVVLTHPDIWPNDRLLRPFVREFPNVHLDLSHVITAGGLESFVAALGADRLLYGSGFPRGYFGAGMHMIRQAELSAAQKKAIAADNLQSILEAIDYD